MVKRLQRSFRVESNVLYDEELGRNVLYERRALTLPDELLATVPSCFKCNVLKGTRKLVPPSWADRIPALKAAIPGAWRVWTGDVKDPAFSAVHK